METRRRSITKAVIWNILGLISMSLIGLAATGSVALGGKLALINTGVGLACYFLYERVWSKISWGRVHA